LFEAPCTFAQVRILKSDVADRRLTLFSKDGRFFFSSLRSGCPHAVSGIARRLAVDPRVPRIVLGIDESRRGPASILVAAFLTNVACSLVVFTL
jgi:hypothetical protein